MSLEEKNPHELMNLYADILTELNRRQVVRTYNSPVGDYAEWLVKEKMKLALEANSQKGYDAIDPRNGFRYQIKSRWERNAPSPQSRELNVIRNYDKKQFDYLIALIFDKEFDVKEAYLIPHDMIARHAKFSKHQNGYILTLMGPILHDPAVKDITKLFSADDRRRRIL